MGIKLKNNILSFLLVMLSVAGLTSCGLDTFYVLKAPISNHNPAATLSNDDPTKNYIDFSTFENQNLTSDFKFMGTTIYYKIYGSKSTLSSDITAVENKNTDTNYGASIDLIKSKGYKELRNSNALDEGMLIPATGVNKRVKIRLTDYNLESDSNPSSDTVPCILIDNEDTGTKPKRAETKNGQNLAFNFGRNGFDTNSPKPESGNNDFDGSTPSDNIYYVNMYAVALGHDVTYKFYYSNLLHLGTIKINSSSENNW